MDRVKIHGKYFPVRARLATVDCLSAHADYMELEAWLARMPSAPKKTFIVHGEPQSQDAFRSYIENKLGWSVDIPVYGENVSLD